MENNKEQKIIDKIVNLAFKNIRLDDISFDYSIEDVYYNSTGLYASNYDKALSNLSPADIEKIEIDLKRNYKYQAVLRKFNDRITKTLQRCFDSNLKEFKSELQADKENQIQDQKIDEENKIRQKVISNIKKKLSKEEQQVLGI